MKMERRNEQKNDHGTKQKKRTYKKEHGMWKQVWNTEMTMEHACKLGIRNSQHGTETRNTETNMKCTSKAWNTRMTVEDQSKRGTWKQTWTMEMNMMSKKFIWRDIREDKTPKRTVNIKH